MATSLQTRKLVQLVNEWKACLPLKPEDEQRLWKKLRLDWNYHSNHIEGNTLTYGETELLFKYNQTHGGHDLRDYEEMKAHDVAITRVQEFARGAQPLTQVEIRIWNEILLKEPFWKNAVTPEGASTRKQIIPGRYKTQPNSVVMPSGEIFKFADPMDVPAKMSALTEKINRYASSIPDHLAEAMAEIHHEFVVIHPFDDGNGRVARLILNFLLLRHQLVPIVVPSEEKKRYLISLQAVDGGFLDTFSDYINEKMIAALSLGIKAGQGEGVEDPFDVEKEIAIFARQQDVVLAPALRKNAELLQELNETSLLPFFASAIEKVGTLAKLFREMRLKVNHSSRENDSWRDDFNNLSVRNQFW